MENVNRLLDDVNVHFKNVIFVIGLLWILFIVVFLSFHAFCGFRTFIWSRMRNLDLVKLYGEFVVITGATDGIGLEFARQFAERGHSIVLFGRNAEKLNNTKNTIESLLKPGRSVVTILADFNDADVTVFRNIENNLQDIKNKIGILINNAGVLLSKPDRYLDLREEEILANINVNITAVLMVTRVVLPFMIANKKGLIINMSSISAMKPLPLTGVYSASKKFVEYFGATLAYEYKNENVDVMTVVPSYITTKMVQWSNYLSKPSILFPSPKRFVKSAIATIGRTKHTTAYWTHAILWTSSTWFVPNRIYYFLSWYSIRGIETRTKL